MLTLPWHDQPSRFFSPAFPRWKWGWNCCCSVEYFYSFCGQNASGTVQKTTYEYNSSDAWAAKTDIPSPARFYVGVCAISSKAYIIGGTTGSGGLSDNDEYTPAGDSSTSKTDAPSPARRGYGGNVAIGTKAYHMYGGTISSTANYKDNDEYDPSGDSWTSRTDGNTPARDSGHAAAISTKAYFMCGAAIVSDIVTTFYADNDEYDQSGDSWTARTDASPTRWASCNVNLNGTIYVSCGFSSSGTYLRDHDQYNPPGTDTFTAKTDITSPGRFHTSAAAFPTAGALYLHGGQVSGTQAISTNDQYIPDAWTTMTPTGSPDRRAHGACTI